ncbi:MAG TPA: DNA topoisomerase IB [Flavipsychrobacter sp.]|nr:DNA topoisomerase IB [Flavipsychrobacter sp.]
MEAAAIKITRRKLKLLVNDHEKTAAAVNLIYVNDTQPGILRLSKGNSFVYKIKNKTVTDFDTLARIKSLVIPPAWKNVWICADENGHLQATGIDVKNRKQYKYHPLWNKLRNHTKFFNLHDFGLALPTMRERLQQDLRRQGLPQEKVLAAVVSLMQCTCIRIGNSFYEKMNGSFGLTTLKDQHVKINGHSVKFSFKGKKGVYHDITMKSRKLARIVQACKDIPGKELFQYYDEKGDRKSIDSGMVNNYIRQISGGNFTAKDFRTWAGSLHALRAFQQLGYCDTATETKRKVVEALDMVAKQLNNTRTVCKKYYVHPALIELYSDKSLEKFFSKTESENCSPQETELSFEEKILLTILTTHGHQVVV